MDIGDIVLNSFELAPWGWGLFATVLLAVVRTWPTWKQIAIGEHAQIRQEYVSEIKALREENKDLQDKIGKLMAELMDVRLELAGYKKQHLAGQAAAICHAQAVLEAIANVAKQEVSR